MLCRNQQWLSLESAETRLSLYRLCVNQSGMSDDLIKFISKAGASEGIRLQSQGCKPFFVFLRFGSAVAAVDGVNANGLSMMLDLHLPKVVKKKKDEE